MVREQQIRKPKKMTDEKRKQIAMNIHKRGFGIRKIALLTKWTDDDIKRLKKEVENQEFKKIANEEQKQITTDMFKRRFGTRGIALLVKWTHNDVKKLKELAILG
jgi:GTP cyclohydrolase II